MSAKPNPKFEGAKQSSGSATELLALIRIYRELGKISPDVHKRLEEAVRLPDNVHPLGRSRKVSVSLPEELAAAVQRRVGRGEFSQYVADALERKLRQDLLAELDDELEAEYGPIPEEYLAEARAVMASLHE